MSPRRNSTERRAAGGADLAASEERDPLVEVVEYDDAWPERFSREAARLADLVVGLDLHHIGSTAVAGLPSKPIIDMMARVDDLDAPLPALIAAGYQYPVKYNAVLEDRRWLCFPTASDRTHHMHLVARDDELCRHLRFRDALRSDPLLAHAYAELKRRLAQQFATDREGYTAAKTEFVERVLADF